MDALVNSRPNLTRVPRIKSTGKEPTSVVRLLAKIILKYLINKERISMRHKDAQNILERTDLNCRVLLVSGADKLHQILLPTKHLKTGWTITNHLLNFRFCYKELKFECNFPNEKQYGQKGNI